MARMIIVERAKGESPLGTDVYGWLDAVWTALDESAEELEALDSWQLWPLEVYFDRAIVANERNGKIYRVDLKVKDDKVTLSNVTEVVNQWVPAEEIQRSAVETESVSFEPKKSVFSGLI